MINIIETKQGKIATVVVDINGVAKELVAIKTEGESVAGTRGYIYFIPTRKTF